MECSVDGCTNRQKYVETGWCQTHYHRWWRTGTLEILPKPVRDDLTYRGAHARVNNFYGPAKEWPCIDCGELANEWAYDSTDPTERDDVARQNGKDYPVKYSVWPEFYMPMCFGCHRLHDRSAWAERRTHCINGHEMTPENTYTRPSRPGTRECRTCKANEGRERYLRKKALKNNWSD